MAGKLCCLLVAMTIAPLAVATDINPRGPVIGQVSFYAHDNDAKLDSPIAITSTSHN